MLSERIKSTAGRLLQTLAEGIRIVIVMPLALGVVLFAIALGLADLLLDRLGRSKAGDARLYRPQLRDPG